MSLSATRLLTNSGEVGIEIQGDQTLISDNSLLNNEVGMHACGENSTTCDFPGEIVTTATGTVVDGNSIINSPIPGIDKGVDTLVRDIVVIP